MNASRWSRLAWALAGGVVVALAVVAFTMGTWWTGASTPSPSVAAAVPAPAVTAAPLSAAATGSGPWPEMPLEPWPGDALFEQIMQGRRDMMSRMPMYLWKEAGRGACHAYENGGQWAMFEFTVAAAGSQEDGGWLWGAAQQSYCPQFPLQLG